MQTQTYGPALAALCLDDIETRAFGEPRVYDFTLARALGYQHARNIRRLIKAGRAELLTHGDLLEIDDRTGGTGNLFPAGANARAGRPGTAFYLNEAQALVICAVTRTAIAARVRGEIIRVFMLWRAGRLDRMPALQREALRAILEDADVVLAPMAHMPARLEVIGEAEDGKIPYLLAPVTFGILDALAEFEACDDLEPEEDVDLADSASDLEYDEADREPSLGSIAADENESQGHWSGGNPGGDDKEDAAEARLGRRRSRPRQEYLNGYRTSENAVAAAESAKRLFSVLNRVAAANLLPARAYR